MADQNDDGALGLQTVTPTELADWEMAAIGLAKRAGRMIRNTCGMVHQIDTKQSQVDLVTETDKNVELFIFDYLRRNFPNHNLVGEESVSQSETGRCNMTDAPTWVIDPVDGTTNFVHTLPFVAICIGLAIEKKPVMGVVYFPLLEKLYTARHGRGAFCNGLPIRCSQVETLSRSLVCIEFGSDRSEERMNCVFKNMESLVNKCHGIRAMGSAAANICAVASGQAEAFYEFGLHCWDICAPGIILLEAGGCLRDTTGGEFDLLKRRVIAASNSGIADELAKSLPVQLDIPSD